MAEFKGLRGKTLSVRSAADYLDCSDRTVIRLIEDGDLIAIRLRKHGGLKILRSSFESYLRDLVMSPTHDEGLAERITAARRARNEELRQGRNITQLTLPGSGA